MLTKLRARRDEAGFTLVELLIVVAILGVLASVVVFSVVGVQDDSQKSACQTEAATVRTAQEAYYVKNKNYATAAQLQSSGLLSKAPALVTVTPNNAATPKTYSLAWVAPCDGSMGTP